MGMEERPLRIAILAAEPSGDLQGAFLARELRRQYSNLCLMGAGGQNMHEAGVRLWVNTQDCSVIGPFDVFRKLPQLLRLYRITRASLLEERPDLTILIDSPAANMRFAGVLAKHGLRTVYYFPPSAWTRSAKRLREIHSRVDAVVCTFDTNYRAYRDLGLPVAFFGHPLADIIKSAPGYEAARHSLNLSGKVLALLPGSRQQEIDNLLPVFLQTVEHLHTLYPDLQVVLPAATPFLEKRISRLIGREQSYIRLLSGSSTAALAACDCALLSSGTACLEASLMGKPHVICYRFGLLNAIFGKLLLALRILRLEHIGLPNLVLGRRAVPEFIQEQASVQNLVPWLCALLSDTPLRQRQLLDLSMVQTALGKSNTIGQIAGFVLKMALGQKVTEA